MTMKTQDMKVDGNAISGLLREIFTMEMTTADAACGHCGTINAIGRIEVYMHAPGTVMRCPSCEQVMMRIVRAKGRYWVDMSGVRWMELFES
jgi:hypothetical protein